MARYVFKLPDVGEGIAEAEIIEWHVEVGDNVREDQPIVDVMTDKATVEISSPVAGKIVSRIGEPGRKAAVGTELVTFETGVVASEPRARPPAGPAPAEPAAGPSPTKSSVDGKILAAPAIRARAAKLGIDLAKIPGTGPDGRVVHQDLDRLLQQQGPTTVSAPAIPKGGEQIAIFGLRRRIAERMLESKRRIPHFTFVEEVDVTALEELRRELNASAAGRPRLTLLPFLIRALVEAVAEHPGVNAHFDDAAAVIHRHAAVHAGIATQTKRGLLVPVIHDAQKLDLSQLAEEILRLSEEARAGKSHREDLTGSTITVTSLGALGGIAATPIINPPEVAIVGVNRIAERAVVRGGRIAIAKMMNLSSSFDHRIVDGYEAAAFIQAVKVGLESPTDLTLT